MGKRMDYSDVRGFNIHGDWGCNGVAEWLDFDAERYKKMIAIGKKCFPGMNTVRVWLSFDAYAADKRKFLNAVKIAADILTQADLNIIPVYLNGWFGIPSFGGFVLESIQDFQLPFYVSYIRDAAKTLNDANVLMHDVSNEPFNNSWHNIQAVVKFLEKMVAEIRRIDDRAVTIGSQGYTSAGDIDALAPLVDVFSMHPYNINNLSLCEFEKEFGRIIDYLKPFGKPYLITECVWGSLDAESRRSYLETELATYDKFKVGFLCHSLFTSPVADLHPLSEHEISDKALYMAFLDKDFNIRPYHDIFNKYAKAFK